MIINEKVQLVVETFDPSTGESPKMPKITSSPENAIENWFKLNQKYPTCVAIMAMNEESGMAVYKYAYENQDIIKSLASKYKSPYKIDYILKLINKKYKNGRTGITTFPDQLDPFCFG